MFKTLCKILCALAIISSLLAVCGYMAVRYYTIAEAQAIASNIIEQALPHEVETPDQEVIALAKAVFDTFQEREPSNFGR